MFLPLQISCILLDADFVHQLLYVPGAENATWMPLTFKVKMVHVKLYADLSMSDRLLTSFLVYWVMLAVL